MMVLWLYGDSMQIPRGVLATSKAEAKARWTVPQVAKDSFAPFWVYEKAELFINSAFIFTNTFNALVYVSAKIINVTRQ